MVNHYIYLSFFNIISHTWIYILSFGHGMAHHYIYLCIMLLIGHYCYLMDILNVYIFVNKWSQVHERVYIRSVKFWATNVYIFNLYYWICKDNGDKLKMDIDKIIMSIIFMVIGAVIFIVLLPVILTTLSPVLANATYVKQYQSTLDLLDLLPLILTAIVIIYFVKFFKSD